MDIKTRIFLSYHLTIHEQKGFVSDALFIRSKFKFPLNILFRNMNFKIQQFLLTNSDVKQYIP